MQEFLVALAMHYYCNAVAETRRLAFEEATQCGQAYNAVKAYFLTPAEQQAFRASSERDQIQMMKSAYVRFKVWELDNPDMVRRVTNVSLGFGT